MSSASAQIGFKAGIGASDIMFKKLGQTPYLGYEVDDFIHNYPKLTYQFGVFAVFGLSEKFEFQPELLFVNAGLDYSTTFNYGKIIYRLNINYLQVPLLFNFKTKPQKTRHFTLTAGPYGAIKLSAKKTIKIEEYQDKEAMSNVKNFDFGIAAGLGYVFDLRQGSIVIDFRVTYGLIDMMQPIEGFVPEYNGTEKIMAKNLIIALTVGYRFLNLWPEKTG
jgi:hypothetical protein